MKMKGFQEQHATEELHSLTEAELEAVSGGAFSVDLGPLGVFSFDRGCFEYTQIDNGTKSWSSVGQC
jgi:hypothetical protein